MQTLVRRDRTFLVSRCELHAPFGIESLGTGGKLLGEFGSRRRRILPILL